VIDSPLFGLLLLAVLAAAPLVLRRMKAAAPDGLRVLGRTALHKGAVVAVVAVGDRRFVLGAGERGVQLLSELPAAKPPAPELARTERADRVAVPSTDRTDAVVEPSMPTGSDEEALEALLGPPGSAGATAGPGIGLVDRLRAMTVRTTPTGRPIRVPLSR
jgi:flagellar biogenesis protein FliO